MILPPVALRFVGIAAILLVWIVFRLWKSRGRLVSPLFPHQRWTLDDAVVGLTLMNATIILEGVINNPAVWWAWWLKQDVQILALFLVLWGFSHFYLKRPLSTIGLSCQNRRHLSLYGVIWGISICAGFAIIVTLIPEKLTTELIKKFPGGKFDTAIKFHGELLFGIYYFFHALWIVSFATLTEEIGYRGLFYGALRQRTGFATAMIITALCFTLAHFRLDPLTFGLGCLLAYLVEKYKSLMPAILVHFLWDLSMVSHQFFVGIIHLHPTRYFEIVVLLAAGLLGIASIMLHTLKRR